MKIDIDRNKEPIQEIIEMDLVRSVSFYNSKNHDKVKSILVNCALEYPVNGYYQGMHYIGIFLYDFFENEKEAFQMLCYITELLLIGNFANTSGGFLRLVWMTDRLMQLHSPSLWETLQKNDVSSVHFATANICTLLTCLVKTPETTKLIPFIWDVMLARGVTFIYDILLYILDVQKAHIDQITLDQLLPAMQNVDSDPFAVLRKTGLRPDSLEKCLKHLTKENLQAVSYDPRTFHSLDRFYERLIKEVQKHSS
jgi:hypothetical protein